MSFWTGIEFELALLALASVIALAGIFVEVRS